MSRVERRVSNASAIAAPPTTYISPRKPRLSSTAPSAVSAATISARFIALDALQSALRDEDASPPERRRRLDNRERPERRRLRYEPKPVQEAVGFHRPSGALDALGEGEMLGQGAKVSIFPSVTGWQRDRADSPAPSG